MSFFCIKWVRKNPKRKYPLPFQLTPCVLLKISQHVSLTFYYVFTVFPPLSFFCVCVCGGVFSQVVVLSGHLDSWDVGQGAMDDGGGAMISWEALSLIKDLGDTETNC